MPTVSVIMGVYNCSDENELRKSVESIILQTYEDWEFIICNDGSTNQTLNMLNSIAGMDSRISIISYEKNKGLSYALNECIKQAKGIYIARQDADDASEKSRLQKQFDFLQEHPQISIVGTQARVFDNNGIWGEYKVPEKPIKKDFLWSSPFLHPATMMRKDDLIRAGAYRIAKETKRCEDYDLFMRMYSLKMYGYNLQEYLYDYKIIISNQKYRPMKDRIDEAKVRWIGYRKLHMLPIGIPYVFKPIIIGLIPQKIFSKIRRSRY